MKRREFIVCLGSAAAWPSATFAQSSAKRPLVAIMLGGSPGYASFLEGFQKGMRELGYVDGRNVDFLYRYANGDVSRMPMLVNELLPYKPAVFVVGINAGMLAIKTATSSVPIINPTFTDPEGSGMVASQRHPGGQVTGILYTMGSLVGKQLELLLRVSPGISKIGGLYNASSSINTVQRRDAEAAARAVGVSLLQLDVRLPDDIDPAFRAFATERVEAVVLPGETLFLSERKRIAALATAARLPIMSTWRELVYDGCLMSYGTSIYENWRRAAAFVDKILKGEKPGDLPLEFPTRVDLVINLKATKALGLTVPATLLAQADELIE